MSALSMLLQAYQADRTTRALADRTGGELHFATIAKYLRGDHPADPSEATLSALSQAFGIPLRLVQQAAGVPVGAGPYTPPPEAARLTRRQQAALTELIMSMVEREGESDASSVEPREKMASGGEPRLLDLSVEPLDVLDDPRPEPAPSRPRAPGRRRRPPGPGRTARA